MHMRAQGIKPKLSDDQKMQLKECFELMDQDGSGAIDADELGAAFKLLGGPACSDVRPACVARVPSSSAAAGASSAWAHGMALPCHSPAPPPRAFGAERRGMSFSSLGAKALSAAPAVAGSTLCPCMTAG